MAEQTVLDFTDVADAVIFVCIDGREVELPRRDLIVAVGPDGRVRGRYVLPESVLEPAPVCAAPPPPHTPPYQTGTRGSAWSKT